VGIPAIVTAGDRGAAKPIYGQSKVYLEVAGLPLVARIVLTLQRATQIDDVWVVGDRDRLEALFADPEIRRQIHKPLHITPQHANLYENAWETFKRALPDAGPEGRTPEGDDLDARVLYVSGDLPFATPQEIDHFILEGIALDCDYVLGLVTELALAPYLREGSEGDGLDIAFFNLREGRLRQNNLHLAKPARILKRSYIQDMYRHRHMRAFGNMIGLGSVLLFREGGITIAFFYLLMHLGGLADRKGWKRLARFIRYGVTLKVNERGISKLLDCSFRFSVSDVGGSAIDVDTEEEYDLVQRNFERWSKLERDRATALLGPGSPETNREPSTAASQSHSGS
jgi:CTP:molybdopterin cytidylyltransferase MocA